MNIDITKSGINTLNQLLKLQHVLNTKPILYKKTANEFKKRYGIELKTAPSVFVKNQAIYKLSHITFKNYRGKTLESAEYIRIAGVGNRFKRLETKEINV